MNRTMIWTVAMVAAALTVVPSFAATYSLKAGSTTVTMPGNSTPITMWGYGLNGGPITVPGPTLTVPPGDTTLTIILTNNLPVPTSIVIPGLTTSFFPVRTADPQGRQRIRAFTAEAAANNGTATYTWTGVKPGTFVYHSGSFPALQVQMGLYGVVKQDFAANTAYPGVTYAKELTLVYSEIDPLLPARQTPATYTQTRGVAGYVPKYFLVNGQPYSAATPPISGLNINDRVLIRLVNAGLKTHVPTLLGGYLTLVAEDANPYPFQKKQYSVNLPPLKTIDALWVPTANGTYPFYDRSLDLTNNGSLGGGMLSKLVVGAVPGAPVAVNDSYPATEDAPLVVPAAGVLANDTGTPPLSAVLVANGTHGTIALNANGSFTYTPQPNYFGPDLFKYKAVSGGLESNVASVTINVAAVNDAPVAANDAASTTAGTPVIINVLANDTDPDGDVLVVNQPLGAATNGTAVVNADQTVSFTPSCATPCTGSFTYQAKDPSGALSNLATVTITVGPAVNQPPVAVDDAAQTKLNTAVTINLVANDSDPDGSINPATVVLTGEAGTPPTITTAQRGTAVNQKNGTVIYTPRRNFRGTDTFTYTVKDNQGATSNTATVRVNVQ